MKDELGGQITTEFVGFITKTYSYLKVSNDEDKKAKDTKKCLIKRKLKFQDYKFFRSSSNREKNNLFKKKKLMQIVLKKIKNKS